MNGHDGLMARVRKLLAMTEDRGCSEGEAANAAAMASALLAEHNLSLEEVSVGDDPEPVTRDEMDLGLARGWKAHVWNAACGLNFVRAYLWPSRRRWYFVGKASNIATARALGEYLVATIERLAAQEVIAASRAGTLNESPRQWAHSFKVGCATRLFGRLDELRRSRMATPTVAPGGTNLPALAPLYNQEKAANDAWIAEHVGRLGRGGGGRSSISSSSGYGAGQRAGNGIALGGELGRGAQARIGR
jgi:hypothetical protein